MESLFLIIPLFFIVIILIPITLKLRLSYNLTRNKGVASIFFGPIKITLLVFKFKGKTLIVKTKKKRREIDIEFSDTQIRFYEQLSVQIEHKVRIKRFDLYGRIGISTADKTALVVALCNIASSSALCVLSSKKRYAENLNAKFYPAYNTSTMQFAGMGKISISIFDILYSMLMSSVIIKRSEKYERL